MKKILTFLPLVVLLISCASTKNEVVETKVINAAGDITFNNVNYEPEYISDFNDLDDFKNKWTSVLFFNPSISVAGSGAKREIQGMTNASFSKNDSFYVKYIAPEFFSVEDGILTMNVDFYREKNNKGGYKYVSESPQINCGVWWDENTEDSRKYPKENYLFKLNGNKLFEMKFKVPKSQYAFEVFFLNRETQYGHTELPNTSKGYHIDELDLMELTTISKEQTKNQIKPRGYPTGPFGDSLSATVTGNYGANSTFKVKDVDEWCNEWHTLDIELTPVSMVCYMDGVKYSECNWGRTLGTVDPDWEWNFRIFPGVFGCWEDRINWDAPDKNYKEFQIDYIKVFAEVK